MGNSLKTIYARITTNQSAVNALDAIGISLDKLDGSSKTATELIQELTGKWDDLSDSQRRNTAVGVAGVNQLSRFNALVLNYDQSVAATATSLDSYNSALREQEIYNQSLEARLNRLQTSYYGVAEAAGKTIVYDGIVVITDLFENAAGAVDSTAGSITTLSLGIGLLGAPLALLSGRFTAFTGGLIQNTASRITNNTATGAGTAGIIANTRALVSNQIAAIKTSVTLRGLGGSLIAVAGSATAAGAALRSLLVATGVGIAIAGVTAALGVFINKRSELIQQEEQFNQSINKNIDALTVNKDRVNQLLDTYNELDALQSHTAEQNKEYLDTQNALAEVFPALVNYIDSTGQAHLKTGDAVGHEIDLVKQLIQARKEEQQVLAKDTIIVNQSEIDKSTKQLATYQKAIDNLRKNIEKGKSGNPLFSDVESYEKTIKKIETEMAKLNISISNQSQELVGSILDIADAFTEIEIDPNVAKQVEELLRSVEFDGTSPEELKAFAESIAEINTALSNAVASGDETAYAKATQDLLNLIASVDDSVPSVGNFSKTIEDLNKASGSVSVNIEYADESVESLGSTAEASAKKIADLQESLNDLKSVEEQLVGVSQSSVDSSEDLLFLYNQLTAQLSGYTEEQLKDLQTKPKLTAEEKNLVAILKQRGETIDLLTVLYPEYAELQKEAISLSNQQLAAIEAEEKANRVLLEAYRLSADGKLTYEQQTTVATAKGVKDRIEATKIEIQSLNDLIKQYQNTANAAVSSQDFIDGIATGKTKASNSSFVLPQTADKLKEQVKGLELDLSQYTGQLNSYVSQIDKINTSVGSTSSKTKAASTKSTSSTKESIYVTDKYKLALEKLNLEIEKQNALQAKVPEYSASNIKSLNTELDLNKQKLKLLQEQEKSLQSQIKSGKIAQTGTITVDNKTTKSTGGTSQSLLSSIAGGRISDTYGTVRAIRNYRPHTGVDIAAPKGTRLNSNVNGTVVSTGNNSLSGNYVQIKDDAGFKHFFGHLDTITTKIGEIITAGQKIGTIGNTGNSTGSHLHYEIKNASGKNFNPIDYVNASYTANAQITQTSKAIDNTQQAIDGAKSDLTSIQSEILQEQANILAIQQAIIDANLAGYTNRRNVLDANYDYEVAKLKNVSVESSKYNKTLDNQVSLLQRKQNVNNEELTYINGLISKGNLSANALATMNFRTLELRTSIEALNTEISQIKFDNIINGFDSYAQRQSDTIDFESLKIKELDVNSTRYAATLTKINTNLNRQSISTEALIKDLQKLISENKESADVIEQAKRKVQELTLDLKNLAQEIASNNFEIVVNVKTRYDEERDDLQFEIDRSQIIEGRYAEGSADATNEINKQIELYKKISKASDDSRKALKAELAQRDLLPEQIKEITELLEDETIAYNNAEASIQSLTKQIEDTNKRLREEIAEALINAYKSYVQERQDEHIKALDDEIKREQDRHNIIMNQLRAENDLFRKNVEERLRLLDREDATRSYTMDIDDLEKERKKLTDSINLLSIDTSNEAKSKRKKLVEQLDGVDKDIKERQYQRDLDLQRQGLNDLLENKEEEINGRQELIDEDLKNTIDRIDREKEYWNKFYTDLLNDERRFAQLRSDILNDNFEKVVNDFQGYIGELESTLPALEDTLDGTMQAVGTSIRRNVIDNLNDAISKIKEFQNSQIATNSITDTFQPNTPKDTTYSGNTSNTSNASKNAVYDNLNTGDFQVLYGKFLADVFSNTLSVPKESKAVNTEGQGFGKSGRAVGSQIPINSHFDNEISKLTTQQKEQFKNFANSNSNILGGAYANRISKQIASLDSGGYIKGNGSGVDGKGGRFGILHPNEVVLNAVDTSRLFDNITISDTLATTLSSMATTFGNMIRNTVTTNQQPNNSSNGGEVYNITFGNVNNATQSSAKEFANSFITEVKSRKGGLW